MSSFGKVIHINLFGESHGDMIGIVINNLPAGLSLDEVRIAEDLTKRRPKNKLSTARVEKDNYKIISGYFNKKTTGTPLTFIIPNDNTISRDYNKDILRPSHADYTGRMKYNGFNDYRGGGHFSGRLTAPLVILGSICSQILESKGIFIASHIHSIKEIIDNDFDNKSLNHKTFERLLNSDFPLINPSVLANMEKQITDAKSANDSVGGTIETAVIGLEAGYGEPFFDSIESIIAHLIFSIPSVKGIEFGQGFDITKLFGSQANDQFIMENGQVKTITNNSGGIQGGISNGMPITFKTAIKPTASISKKQNTINIKTKEHIELELQGRHDPAIVHRVVPVINAVTSYSILEIILRNEGLKWMK